jgi:hypothetical protein
MSYNPAPEQTGESHSVETQLRVEVSPQSRVWNLISDRVSRNRIENRTEDYEKLLESVRKTPGF